MPKKNKFFSLEIMTKQKEGENIIWMDQNIFEGLLILQKTQVLRTEGLSMISRYFY